MSRHAATALLALIGSSSCGAPPARVSAPFDATLPEHNAGAVGGVLVASPAELDDDGCDPYDDESGCDDSDPYADAAPELPRGTTVLHFGDSFADALGQALLVELAQLGIRAVNRPRTGSYIPEWAGMRSEVPWLIKSHDPDLVVITLGGNELRIRDPESRAEAIRRLVRFVGDRPCVWVAPSLWRGERNQLFQETGLLAVIRENAKPCRYFDTNALVGDLERTGDRIHPTVPARRVWARAFVGWLQREIDPRGQRPWALRPE